MSIETWEVCDCATCKDMRAFKMKLMARKGDASAKSSAVRTYEILATHLLFREKQLLDQGKNEAADELRTFANGCLNMIDSLTNDEHGASFRPGLRART